MSVGLIDARLYRRCEEGWDKKTGTTSLGVLYSRSELCNGPEVWSRINAQEPWGGNLEDPNTGGFESLL